MHQNERQYLQYQRLRNDFKDVMFINVDFQLTANGFNDII